MQSIGMNHLGGLADAREIVRASFEPEIYEPTHNADWDEAYSRIKNSSNDFNRSAKRD
jgi:hypothetical protein